MSKFKSVRNDPAHSQSHDRFAGGGYGGAKMPKHKSEMPSAHDSQGRLNFVKGPKGSAAGPTDQDKGFERMVGHF
jgi:hypothetical protein